MALTTEDCQGKLECSSKTALRSHRRDTNAKCRPFQHDKPDPETYLGAARLLGLRPAQVMMVAAHNSDLKAAQQLGLKTTFVARPTEYGPLQNRDFEATGEWDMVAKDFPGIAERMGC